MIAAANLFPQAPHSLELPLLYDATPAMSFGLEFSAMASCNDNSINTSDSTLTGNIDYHSSDQVLMLHLDL